MEPQISLNYAYKSKFRLGNTFGVGSSSSSSDPEVVDVDSSEPWVAGQLKRKHNQVIKNIERIKDWVTKSHCVKGREVMTNKETLPILAKPSVVPHEIIEIDGDDDSAGVLILGEGVAGSKKKVPIDPDKETLAKDKHIMSIDDAPFDSAKIMSIDDLDAEDYYFGELDYEDEYYDDYDFHDDSYIYENDHDYSLASKFDNLDLPPGVEAPLTWLESSDEKPSVSIKSRKAMVDDEVNKKFRDFKQFDTVRDCSDHHFGKIGAGKENFDLEGALKQKTAKDWSKTIEKEWRILEKDLPETIYVRAYEDRMDLLRAVIVGPSGTPYHDGLFFFDILFPVNYPHEPPRVHYHSGGLRLNPNLYATGKVCLSLLNTWHGTGTEKWIPRQSTMLQVLVSIQALILNAKPYFNEPGYAGQANTPPGERNSLAYNENAFILSVRTMLFTLRRTPKHFEDYVAGHFRHRGRAILVACRAYIEGAQVGCLVGDGVQDVDEGDKSGSAQFKAQVSRLYQELLMEFTVKGADCDEFLEEKVKGLGPKPATLDTTLKL